MPHVVIVGGGLTGLSVAFRLKQVAPDVSVTVLEPRDRPGGNIGTEDHNGFRVERGPNGFLDRTPGGARPRAATSACPTGSSPPARQPQEPLPVPRRQAAQAARRPARAAHHAAAVAPREVAAPHRTVARSRRHDRPADESVAAVRHPPGREGGRGRLRRRARDGHSRRRPGDAERRGGVPPPAGDGARSRERRPRVHAGGEAAAGATRRPAANRRPARCGCGRSARGCRCSRTRSPAQLGPAVQTRGARCGRCPESASVAPWKVYGDGRDAWSADAVVLACPAYEQAAILAELDPPLADEVAGIPYNRIAVVALGLPRRPTAPAGRTGSGTSPRRTRAATCSGCSGVRRSSRTAPRRGACCGGRCAAASTAPSMVDWDDDALARAVHEEMKLAMGVTGEPVFRADRAVAGGDPAVRDRPPRPRRADRRAGRAAPGAVPDGQRLPRRGDGRLRRAGRTRRREGGGVPGSRCVNNERPGAGERPRRPSPYGRMKMAWLVLMPSRQPLSARWKGGPGSTSSVSGASRSDAIAASRMS